MKNNVNHPTHYNKPGRKECIVEMHEKYGLFMTSVFCLLNVYKYLYRDGEKEENPKVQDQDKALWYYDWVIEKTTNAGGNMILDTDLFRDVNKMIMETDFNGMTEICVHDSITGT